jgi:hypothetical protein
MLPQEASHVPVTYGDGPIKTSGKSVHLTTQTSALSRSLPTSGPRAVGHSQAVTPSRTGLLNHSIAIRHRLTA